MERKNLKKIPSYLSEKKWHLQATELCLATFFFVGAVLVRFRIRTEDRRYFTEVFLVYKWSHRCSIFSGGEEERLRGYP